MPFWRKNIGRPEACSCPLMPFIPICFLSANPSAGCTTSCTLSHPGAKDWPAKASQRTRSWGTHQESYPSCTQNHAGKPVVGEARLSAQEQAAQVHEMDHRKSGGKCSLIGPVRPCRTRRRKPVRLPGSRSGAHIPGLLWPRVHGPCRCLPIPRKAALDSRSDSIPE